MPVDKNDKFNRDYRHKSMNESGTDEGEGNPCCLYVSLCICLAFVSMVTIGFIFIPKLI